MNKTVVIGKKKIGDGHPAFIIAEAGSNHNQNIKQAKELIDIAAQSAVDAVKFQLFKADVLYKPTDAAFKIVQENEFPRDWLKELVSYAKKKNLLFLATPFDKEAVDLLCAAGVSALKIASSEVVNLKFLKYVAQKGKPIILSTGMCNIADIYEALEVIYQTGNKNVVLLQCTALYPTKPAQVHLNVMKTLCDAFKVPVGFSDHSLGILLPPIAIAKGACMIEKHFTISRKLNGPDHSYAIEPQELNDMVKNIRIAEESFGDPHKRMLAEERKFARRESLFAKVDIIKGTLISDKNIEIRRPAAGIDPRFFRGLVGSKVQKNIKKGDPVSWDVIAK